MIEFKTLLAFAKDSVSCMAYFYQDSWSAPPDELKSPFSGIMGEAIIRFTLYYQDWLNRVAEEVVDRVDEDPDEFFEFGYELADELFQEEPFMELIAICSFISYIAHIYFKMGKKHFMDKAYFMIAILFLKLRDKFEANGGWKNFQILCLKFVEMVMEEGKKEHRKLTETGKNSSEKNIKLTSGLKNSTRISKHSIVKSSKCAGSVEESDRTTGTRLKSTGVISKSAGVNLKSTGAISKSTGAVPKSTGAVPKSTGAVPKSTGAVPKSTGAVPKSTGAVPKSSGAVPKSTGAVPKSTGAITKSTGAITKSTGAIPKSTGAIPKSTGAIPKSTGAFRKSIEVVPISSGEITKSTNDIPKSTGYSQKSTDANPRSKGTIPKSTEEVEKPSDADRSKYFDNYEIYNEIVFVKACFYSEEQRSFRKKSTERKSRNSSRNRKSI